MSLSEKFGIPASLLDAVKTTLSESDAYQQKVKAHMAKKGVKSLSDMTADQKKKFFNELDSMHKAKNEEVELEEATVIGKPVIKGPSEHKQRGTPGDTHTSVTTHHKVGEHHYKVTTEVDHDGDKFHTVHKTDSAGRNRSVVHKSNTPAYEVHWTQHRHGLRPVHDYHRKPERNVTHSSDEHKANVTKIMKHHDAAVKKHEDSVNEQVGYVEEELKGDMHPGAKKVLKHIKPEHHDKYKPYLKKGVYKGDYKDRAAVLSAAERAKHTNEGYVAEEEEQIDELSKETLTRYANTAASSARHNMAKTAGAKSSKEASKAGQTATKRLVGYHKALKKIDQKNEEFDLDDLSLEDIESFMQTEDYNQLDELSKNTLASYIKKRSNDVATQGALTRKHAMDAEAQKKEHGGYTTKAVRDLDDKANKAFMKGWKHRQNIGKAVDKLTKEELEFIEALNAGTAKE